MFYMFLSPILTTICEKATPNPIKIDTVIPTFNSCFYHNLTRHFILSLIIL